MCVLFFRSSHECTFGLKEGLLSFSACSERHLFKPFSSDRDNGAITEQARSLKFLREEGMSSWPSEKFSIVQ